MLIRSYTVYCGFIDSKQNRNFSFVLMFISICFSHQFGFVLGAPLHSRSHWAQPAIYLTPTSGSPLLPTETLHCTETATGGSSEVHTFTHIYYSAVLKASITIPNLWLQTEFAQCVSFPKSRFLHLASRNRGVCHSCSCTDTAIYVTVL